MSELALDFDANASVAVQPAAWAAWRAAADAWPRLAAPGARRALDDAKAQIAAALGAQPQELILTSGGTAADRLALRLAQVHALAEGQRCPLPLVVSAIEHEAVRAALQEDAARGLLLPRYWPVSASGQLDLSAAAALLSPRPCLLSVLMAHNETGVVQPLAALGAVAQAQGVLLHADAVQAVGRLPICFAEMPLDMLTLASHKVGGVGGAGALLLRAGTPLHATWRRLEAEVNTGTLATAAVVPAEVHLAVAACDNVAGAVALAAALRALPDAAATARLARLRDGLEAKLLAALGPAHVAVLGVAGPRLANTSCLHFPGAPAEAVLMALDMAGFAVSAGAACASGALEPSPSLLAMQLTPRATREVVRISLTHASTEPQVEALCAALIRIVPLARAAEG